MAGLILGEKSIQSQTFDSKGQRIPTTFIKTTSCYVVDVKDQPQASYLMLKLGFGQIKNIKKPALGELNKAGIKTPLRFLREFKIKKSELIKTLEEGKGLMFDNNQILIGQEIDPSIIFKKGEKVKVAGSSKGKGFQGVVKRHKFAGGPKTHGQSDRERAPGSIGQTTTPGRVYKGKRMAGRMGGVRVTVRNLEVVDINKDGILVKGLVPGPKRGLLEISNIK